MPDERFFATRTRFQVIIPGLQEDFPRWWVYLLPFTTCHANSLRLSGAKMRLTKLKTC